MHTQDSNVIGGPQDGAIAEYPKVDEQVHTLLRWYPAASYGDQRFHVYRWDTTLWAWVYCGVQSFVEIKGGAA